MKRRAFLTITAAATLACVAASAAQADGFSDGIVAQLTQQGFQNIATETTWLGRSRIVGSRVDGQREIIINPRTGEILRDLWTSADGVQTPYPILDDVGGKTGASGSGEGTGGGSDDGSGEGGGSGSGGSGGGSGGESGDGSGGDSGGHGEGGGKGDDDN